MRAALKSTLRGAIGVAVVVAAVSGVRTGWPRAAPAPDGVAQYTVAAQPFVRRVTAEGNLRAVTATQVMVPETPGMWIATKLAWLAPDGRPVAKGDVIARFDRSDADKQLRDARADLAAADVALRKAQLVATAAVEARRTAALIAAQDAAQASQPVDPDATARNEIVAGQIDARLAGARQLQAEQAMPIDRRISQTKLALLAIARQRAQLALGHAELALASMEVRAPGDGILLLRRDERGELPKLGAALSSGNAIAELPVLDAMEAELFVLETDGGGLEVGQPAELVVESRPDRTFHGVIRVVDKLAKPRQAQVPVQYFSVVIALDQTDRAVMKPGQRVRATLVLDAQRALVVPRQAVVERDHQLLVYRRGAHGWTPAVVTLGAATAGRVIITSGLAEGDVIAERDPTRPADPNPDPPAGSAGASAASAAGKEPR